MLREPLPQLWSHWRDVLAEVPYLQRVVRPPLLPHLRTVDETQIADVVLTLSLDGFTCTPQQVQTALAARALEMSEAGWPGPLSRPEFGANAPARFSDITLNDYAEALSESRLTILELLQGADAVATLATAYLRWRRCCGGKRDRIPAGDLAVMWDLAEREGNWNLRAVLLHLAVWRLEDPALGVGRLARLVMNTLRAAGGHAWLSIPVDRKDDYRRAVAAALTEGDARPWADLLAAVEPPRPHPRRT